MRIARENPSYYFGLANLKVVVVKGALVASVTAAQTSALELSDCS